MRSSYKHLSKRETHRNLVPSYVDACFCSVGRSRILGIACLLALLMLGILAWSPALAHTRTAGIAHGGTGHIYGRLLDGSKNNSPLAGQTVTLQVAQGNNSKDAQTTITDAGGNYSFSSLSNDKTLTYAVYIRYQNANYSSDSLSLVNQPEQKVDLTVYDATTDSSKMAVIESTLLVKQVDSQRHVLNVSAIFAFKNLDGRAFVGSLDATQGRPKALFFPLPAGARAISLQKGLIGYRAIQAGNGFATDAMVPPGDSEFSYGFEVPYTGTSFNYDYKAIYPTLGVSLLVPTQYHVSSPDITPKGVVNNADRPYNLYTAANLPPERQVVMKIEGLPQAPESVTGTGTGTSSGLNSIWVIVLIIVLVGLVILLWNIVRIVRVKMGLEPEEGKRDKARGRGSKHATAEKKATSRAQHEDEEAHSSSQEKRRKALMEELLELDKEYEAGKISKSAYQEKRNKTKALLRTIMREQEATRR